MDALFLSLLGRASWLVNARCTRMIPMGLVCVRWKRPYVGGTSPGTAPTRGMDGPLGRRASSHRIPPLTCTAIPPSLS